MSQSSPASIRFLVFDVDGVLTDGGIYLDDSGIETKRFHVRDGLAMKLAMDMGLQIGVITGRSKPGVALRMKELGITLYLHGIHNKAQALQQLCEQAGVPMEQTAFVGDDLIDLSALRVCGYPITVADAIDEAKALARYVTKAAGGNAAGREVIEYLFKAQGRWDEAVKRFG